jgi:DNA-binding NtrC family response regulator
LYINRSDPAESDPARRVARVRILDRFALSNWPIEEPPRGAQEAFRDAEGREITRMANVREVYERARQAAESDAPVLILGETGTGKELLARYLHASSRRARGPLVPVNCGAVPAGTIDSHLFGHARGAFTGAVADSQGLVGAADGGTLFLDEIGELPLETQGRLLRLLQDGEAMPVGAGAARRVDVRIVAATHRNLRKLIHEERFREDLYFRLANYVFLLPPLRERRDDLELLCEALVMRWRDERGVTARIDRGAWRALHAYDWPGNVRELQAILTRALIDARRGSAGELIIDRAIVERALREQGLGPGVLPEEQSADWIDPVLAQVTASGRTYGEALYRIEAALIGRAMRQCRSRAEAARRLGMTPQALHAKLKTLSRHGITV